MVSTESSIADKMICSQLDGVATYAIVLRGSEYDLPPEMLDDIVASTIAQKRHDFGMDHGEEIAV